MKITTSEIIKLIRESLDEADLKVLLEGPISGGGMGASDTRPTAGIQRFGQTRGFNPKAAEAFAAKFNYDFDKIAALQNDEAFMSNDATRKQWAEFNDYAATNLPPEWKAKWQLAVSKANKAAEHELSAQKPGLIKRVVGSVANKLGQLAGGKKLSGSSIQEIEALVGQVLVLEQQKILENEIAAWGFVKKLQEAKKV